MPLSKFGVRLFSVGLKKGKFQQMSAATGWQNAVVRALTLPLMFVAYLPLVVTSLQIRQSDKSSVKISEIRLEMPGFWWQPLFFF